MCRFVQDPSQFLAYSLPSVHPIHLFISVSFSRVFNPRACLDWRPCTCQLSMSGNRSLKWSKDRSDAAVISLRTSWNHFQFQASRRTSAGLFQIPTIASQLKVVKIEVTEHQEVSRWEAMDIQMAGTILRTGIPIIEISFKIIKYVFNY